MIPAQVGNVHHPAPEVESGRSQPDPHRPRRRPHKFTRPQRLQSHQPSTPDPSVRNFIWLKSLGVALDTFPRAGVKAASRVVW